MSATIKALAIDRESFNVRSSGDERNRVDAYFVEFDCPPDRHNPDRHIWICRFEVPCGAAFKMANFPSKSAAHAAKGWEL